MGEKRIELGRRRRYTGGRAGREVALDGEQRAAGWERSCTKLLGHGGCISNGERRQASTGLSDGVYKHLEHGCKGMVDIKPLQPPFPGSLE